MRVDLSLVKSNIGIQKNGLNSVYSTKPLDQPKMIKSDTVSFGHYLDDELEDNMDTLDGLKKKIKKVESEIEDQRESNKEESNKLDRIINEKRSANRTLSNQIEDLSKVESEKGETVNTLKREGKTIETNLNSRKQRIGQLKQEQEEILGTIDKQNIEAEKKLKEQLKTSMVQTQESLDKDLEKTLSNPKNTLIQNVLNPTILEAEGNTVQVPSGVLFESESSDVSKKVFEWMTRKTNSNYAVIDASAFGNKPRLFKMVNILAEKSKKEFMTDHKRTFTFIENFDNCATPDAKNESIIGALKSFLDDCSSFYHNTIVISTKDPSKLDAIVSGAHRFPVKIKLDKEFLNDKKFGYESIVKELANIVATGKKLTVISFESIIHSLIKRK